MQPVFKLEMEVEQRQPSQTFSKHIIIMAQLTVQLIPKSSEDSPHHL